MIKCKTYNCPAWMDWRCCVECDRTNCSKRCQNHPDRCRNFHTEEETPKSGGRVYDHEQILSMAKRGMTNNQIAEVLGCSETTVANALAKAGFYRIKRGDGHDG